MQQHIAALDFERPRHFARGGHGADLGDRIGQAGRAALKQQVEHRAGEAVLQIRGGEHIIGENIDQVGDRALVEPE